MTSLGFGDKPSETIATLAMSAPVDEVKPDIIKMDQFNYFQKMMFTTCIILEIVIMRTLKINVDNISASGYDEPELRWI